MKEEAIIKIIGKATLEIPDINQHTLRRILDEVLYDYDLVKKSTEIAVRSDIMDKLQLYLISKKMDGLSDITLKEYFRHIKKFAENVPKPLAEIDINDLRRHIATLMQSGLKPSSIETEKSILKSFFTWLEDEDYISKSPARKLKAGKVESRERKYLTTEELELLRDACETTRERALVEFIFSTGTRLSEITQIRLPMIDWQNNSVKVIGKGNKERTVYFSGKAKVYLKKYLLERPPTESEYLFISDRKPHDGLGNRAVQSIIKAIAERSGIDKNVHPHILRHTMATLGYNSGMPLPVIQNLLGHSEPSTTIV